MQTQPGAFPGDRLALGYAMSDAAGSPDLGEHAPQNAMSDPGEIERFYDRCSELMRELLDALATKPDHPRAVPEIEDDIAWPRRRIASVLGGVWHLRTTQFEWRRPYPLRDDHTSKSGRWEIWMDSTQAQAITHAHAQRSHADDQTARSPRLERLPKESDHGRRAYSGANSTCSRRGAL